VVFFVTNVTGYWDIFKITQSFLKRLLIICDYMQIRNPQVPVKDRYDGEVSKRNLDGLDSNKT
jgi:hypothetical protein